MKKAEKKATRAISKVERVKPEVMPKELTLDQRVENVRRDLDTMDGLEQQQKFGSLYIGLQLISIKDETSREDFKRIMEQSILRPSFQYRTAMRWIAAAHNARSRLVQSGKIDIKQIWGVSPSDMTMERRNELQAVLEKVLGKPTLKQLTTGSTPDAEMKGKDVEREAITKGWKALANKVWNHSQDGTFIQMLPEDRAAVKANLKAALDALKM